MQRTPITAASISERFKQHQKKLANGAIFAGVVALVAGLSVSEAQTEAVAAQTAEAAAAYKPATTYTLPEPPTKVAFLGDSFTAGTGAEEKTNRWTSLLSRERGWLELNYGYGGTNYSTGGSLRGGKPYTERLTDLIASDPDIVVVSSAGNNVRTGQESGIHETFQTLREELPKAQIVATSPYYRAGPLPPEYEEFAEDIRQEVERAGGEYLEINHPLENHPEAISSDMVHPNDVGYELIADAVGDELR